jgi:hypothetical protein
VAAAKPAMGARISIEGKRTFGEAEFGFSTIGCVSTPRRTGHAD